MDFKICRRGNKKQTLSETSQQTLRSSAWMKKKKITMVQIVQMIKLKVVLPILAALSEKRLPYMLLANKNAPSSSTSSSMVAVWACSVLFMSFHDSRASGRSRLFTVCTTAWNMWHLLPCGTLLLLLPIMCDVALWLCTEKTNWYWQCYLLFTVKASSMTLYNLVYLISEYTKHMLLLIFFFSKLGTIH